MALLENGIVSAISARRASRLVGDEVSGVSIAFDIFMLDQASMRLFCLCIQ